jgi:hypothetical protein
MRKPLIEVLILVFSDQDINAPEGRLESREKTVIDVEDDIGSSMNTLSVSREDFRSMPESSV